MRYILFVVFLLVSVAGAQESDYATLVERARKGDPDLDFVALREAFLQQPGYSGYDEPDVRRLYTAVQAADWPDAEKAANAILEESYLSLDAHFVLMMAAEERKDEPARAQHDYMLTGLSKAIRNGHDGSSPTQAYSVMSVGEEYAVCRVAGWKVQNQALVSHEDRTFDVMTVIDLDGRRFDIYFDNTSFFGKLR